MQRLPVPPAGKGIPPDMRHLVWTSAGIGVFSLHVFVMIVLATFLPHGIWRASKNRIKFVSDGLADNEWAMFLATGGVVCETALVVGFSLQASRRSPCPAKQPLGSWTPACAVLLGVGACTGFSVLVAFTPPGDDRLAHWTGVALFMLCHLAMHAVAIMQTDHVIGDGGSRRFILSIVALTVLFGAAFGGFFLVGLATDDSDYYIASASFEYVVVVLCGVGHG